MGTITGIGDLDPVRWANSHWRSVKVLSIGIHSMPLKSCDFCVSSPPIIAMMFVLVLGLVTDF